MDLSQKVAFNALVQMASKTTTVVFGLLLTILLTGYLGRDGYGDYMYIITLVVLFGALADWGTAAIGVREAAQRRSDQGRILSNILLVRLVITFGAAFLMSVAAFFLPLQSGNPVVVRQGIVLGSLILLLFATKASFGIIFQTKLQMQKLAVADIVASFLTLLISWFLVRWGLGLLPLIGSVAVANVVALLIVWFWREEQLNLIFP